jgi:Zn-dependent peptidase ImmA (M78 family)
MVPKIRAMMLAMRRRRKMAHKRQQTDRAQLSLRLAPRAQGADELLTVLLRRLEADVENAGPAECVEVLARLLHVNVKYRRLGTSAQLLYDPISPVVFLNADDEWRRQRFSLAHELSHVLVIRGIEGLAQGKALARLMAAEGHTRRIEKLVDEMAAGVVFPLESFARAAEALDAAGIRGFPAVWHLRRQFGASQTAVLRRLADLRTDYLAFGCSWRATPTRPENLRVTWSVGGQGRRGFVARDKGLPAEGPIARAYSGHRFEDGYMKVVTSDYEPCVLRVQATPAPNGALVLVDLRAPVDPPSVQDVIPLVLSNGGVRKARPRPRLELLPPSPATQRLPAPRQVGAIRLLA